MDSNSIKELNSEVRRWSQQSEAMLRNRVKQLTNGDKHRLLKTRFNFKVYKASKKIRHTNLANSIRYRNLREFGAVNRVLFHFAKHGYYLSVGSSRGHSAKTNPRKIVDWYGFIFEKRLDNLADIVAEKYGDEAMKKTSESLHTGYVRIE